MSGLPDLVTVDVPHSPSFHTSALYEDEVVHLGIGPKQLHAIKSCPFPISRQGHPVLAAEFTSTSILDR